MDKGLCGTCRHARLVEGARSHFVRCTLASTDPGFPRYPILPRLNCRGHEEKPPEPTPEGGESPPC